MNEKRRTNLDIVHDILLAMRNKGEPIVPTHLLYKANLPHDRLKGYLKDLLEKRFISEIADRKGKRKYALTDEGYRFLQAFSQMREFTRSFGL